MHKEQLNLIPPGIVALQGFMRGRVAFTVGIEPKKLLIDLLRGHRGTSLWSPAIIDAGVIDTPERWERLITQLGSQARDNKDGMAKIVGPLAAELLLIV